MSMSLSRQSYEDCYEIMDKALEAADGVRVGFEDQDDATYFRMRMNQARTLDRRFSEERYNGDDPRRRKSNYDALSFRIRRNEGRFWVYVVRKQRPMIVEEIKDDKSDPVKPVREVITHRRF